MYVPSGAYPLSAHLGGKVDVAGFRLGLHLVTVSDFRRFMDADGYRTAGFWSSRGWDFVRDLKLSAPRFFGEEKWRRFLTPHRPIVGVSFFEAEAYCSYLGGRLPTEREWEAAARGRQGFDYPWGAKWEEGVIAVRGEGPRVTWPVGTFARAAGPFGHHDLLGNVWQWTQTLSETGPVVVKGGSWASRQDQNRNGTWNAYEHRGRFSHVGFRVAYSVDR